ncbi:hypothetical protein [Hymenobacter rubripertinctus]|uniref:Uncharacterized protein n=1 Tax=Hymenobacter rubripertinctus TaxID=2029981 RepID=A0A418QUG0_9BACT|nr:hypothetical protein [Hymenobacter rubripertinctus]RIY08885.1 hypothetical protein D0T11_13230 [Hymenobacter rubripertinctus]
MADFPRPDDSLHALRPTIASAALLPAEAPATVADFLHAVLRPILKLQNPMLLAVVADFVHDHHVPLVRVAPLDQQRLLGELLARNTKLRYTVVGLVTGLFTTAEFTFYRQHRSELNRRLLELSTRRVQDQAAAVAELSSQP